MVSFTDSQRHTSSVFSKTALLHIGRYGITQLLHTLPNGHSIHKGWVQNDQSAGENTGYVFSENGALR